MEASLRLSAAVDPSRRQTARTGDSGAVEITRTPQSALPLTFIVTGLFAFTTALCWIAWRPDILATYHYNQYVIAATHLVVLGFVSSVIMGAMYQLAPVALETQLFNRSLAWIHYALHLTGFAGMVWMFAVWDMKNVSHFGSAFAVGAGLFAYNLLRTIWRGRRGAVVAIGMGIAIFWLVMTLLAGLLIAAGKCSYEAPVSSQTGWLGETLRFLRSCGAFMARFDAIGAMHAHAHLGVLGFFTTLLVAVSYKLVPMFILSELQSRRRALASIAFLAVGVATLFVAIALRSPLKPVCALLPVIGLVLYGFELRAILQARKRRALDLGLITFLTGLGFLLPVSVLGLVLSWPSLPLTAFTGQLENLYGSLALLAVLALAIIGMVHKIIPFLVWYVAYSPHVGLARLPVFNELFSVRLQWISFAVYLAGIVILVPAIMTAHHGSVRLAGALLTIGMLLVLANVGLMLHHLARPRLQPLTASPISTK